MECVNSATYRTIFSIPLPTYREMSFSDMDATWKRMDSNMNQYLGHVFEDICHEYVLSQGYLEAGGWRSGPDEIDIVALNDEYMLLAECKYRKELTDADLIDDLLDKSESIKSQGLTKRYALFSKSGYTRVAEMRAKDTGVELIRFEDMFE